MLVLTRKIGERIVIGDNIVVCVIEATNNKVRLGIDAPASVPVNRLEVHLREAEKPIEVDASSQNTPRGNDVQRRRAHTMR